MKIITIMKKIIINLWNKVYQKLPVLIFDFAAIPLSWFGAFWLRYNLEPVPEKVVNFQTLTTLCLLLVAQGSCYYYFKVYRGLWKFFSLNDVLRIIKASVAASFIVIPVFYITSTIQFIPRSVLPLYDIILITILCSGRFLRRNKYDNQFSRLRENSKNVLVVGAGQAGSWLLRDIKRDSKLIPLGMVDDDSTKIGLDLQGVRVLGAIHDIPEIAKKFNIDLIFIAIPSASSKTMQRIVQYCELANTEFRTLPCLRDLASGRVAVKALREVKIEDLLGRDQVQLNWEDIAFHISNKNVVITGGGGSIGSELSRQIAHLNPNKLLIIDNCEFNLYQIEMELKENFPNLDLNLALLNVCDKEGMQEEFKKFKPQIVFHAAAFKHVPLLENQTRNAVKNNILGTQVTALASIKANVKKFVLISTDKAVNPTNIMGMTKRVAEIYCQNLNDKFDTEFITVRFGNVLGSVGSVVPLFKKQLEKGGPLTVTHPDIERYFMTISEACQLILESMVTGKGGEIFVLDMGDPIRIQDLAIQMIKLSGKEPHKDIDIKFTGLRKGEKLSEELFHKAETLKPTRHEKLFKAQVRLIDFDELQQSMRMLERACLKYENDEIQIILKSLVPEFCLEESVMV